MVKLTIDMVAKLGPGHNKRRPDETVEHYLNRITHMYLQEKHIEEIVPFPICKNLTVIYLYDNNLKKIENLEFAPNLTHLYLQNNQIKRLENLNCLTKLSKLHIGGNEISVLEGLENLNELEELHIENQHLPPGEKLVFDPRTLMSLVSNLKILNISRNNLDTLTEIGSLANLVELNASDNNLNDMKEMSILLNFWPKLKRFSLSGNPICFKNKYRERIIVLAPNLEYLDDKEIKEISKQFLQNWKISKEISQQNKTLKQETIDTTQVFSNHSTSSFNSNHPNVELPQLNKLNSMPTYVMPEGYQIIVPKEHKKKQFTSANYKNLKAKPIGIDSANTRINKFYENLSSIEPNYQKHNGFAARQFTAAHQNAINRLQFESKARSMHNTIYHPNITTSKPTQSHTSINSNQLDLQDLLTLELNNLSK